MIETYINGRLRERWNDTTRTYTAWDANGVQTSTRAYTSAENSAADARALVVTQASNETTLNNSLVADLADVQTVIDATNATINSNAAVQIKLIARVIRHMLRVMTRKFDGTA